MLKKRVDLTKFNYYAIPSTCVFKRQIFPCIFKCSRKREKNDIQLLYILYIFINLTVVKTDDFPLKNVCEIFKNILFVENVDFILFFLFTT